MDISYRRKYLKYKKKYLLLKNINGGTWRPPYYGQGAYDSRGLVTFSHGQGVRCNRVSHFLQLMRWKNGGLAIFKHVGEFWTRHLIAVPTWHRGCTSEGTEYCGVVPKPINAFVCLRFNFGLWYQRISSRLPGASKKVMSAPAWWNLQTRFHVKSCCNL